jgi:glyceraldehyde-3-phosphate dehydrogenase (NADP+)
MDMPEQQSAAAGSGKQGFLLQGRWTTSEKTYPLRNPYDGSLLAEVCNADPSQVEQALAGAAAAFESFRKLSAYTRATILRKLSDLIRQNGARLAELLAREVGKPLKAARVEVERATFTFAWAAGEAERMGGEVIRFDLGANADRRFGLTRWFPRGPVLAITPFNFPLNLAAHKLAPAIAVGNPVILKPPNMGVLTSLALGELAFEAGLPPEALSVIRCESTVAEEMVRDDRIKVLSFTGSPVVGWALKQKAGKKQVTLELGGNAAVIVDRTADLEFAAKRSVAGAYSYAGQSCISVQRIYVHRSVFDDFLERFLQGTRALKTGDPRDESTDVGPMITRQAAQQALAWTHGAVAAGARLVLEPQLEGSVLSPGILAEVADSESICREEIFAPLVVINPYETAGEALQRVNDSRFGLQAGVFTRDLNLAMRAFEELEVGGVLINEVPTYRLDHMPYGGVKDSGFGREGLKYAIQEMCELKLLVLNSGETES